MNPATPTTQPDLEGPELIGPEQCPDCGGSIGRGPSDGDECECPPEMCAADAYEAAKAAVVKFEKPQDDLLREITGCEGVHAVCYEDTRKLLQHILDMREAS